MEKRDLPRHFNIEGTNRAVFDVLSRSIKYGKKIKFVDPNVSLDTIQESIDDGYNEISQYIKTGGKASFNRDFSYGSYEFQFID